MFKKFGVILVSLLGLIGYCSVGYGAEEAPSIGELEEFAQEKVSAEEQIADAQEALEQGKPYIAREIVNELVGKSDELTDAQAKQVADLTQNVEAALAEETTEQKKAVDEAERARQILDAYRKRMQVERQQRQAEAAQLVERGRQLLYYEDKPEQAYALAQRAVQLDPTSEEAQELLNDAGVELGKESAIRRRTIERGPELVRVRVEAAKAALQDRIAQARQYYGEGKFEQALEQLRRARFYVEMLAVYEDVSSERQEVEALLERVRQDYQQAERRRATEQRAEAAEEAEEFAEQMEAEERRRKARLVEQVQELLDERRFEEATQVVDDLELEDPGEDLVEELREQISQTSYNYRMAQVNHERERGRRQLGVDESAREVAPKRLFDYPTKRFWKEVVEQRENIIYPSELEAIERTDAEQAIYDQLDQTIETLNFDQVPVSNVVDFLRQVTEINFLLLERDVAPGTTVTLNAQDITVRNTLKLISDLTGLMWKVEDGFVKIGSPESLREYVMRTYPVRDLLVSVEDVQAEGGTDFDDDDSDFGGSDRWMQYSDDDDNGAFGVDDDGGSEVLASRARDLIDLIRLSCGQGTWAAGGGVIGGLEEGDDGDTFGFGGPDAGGAGGFGGAGAGGFEFDDGGLGAPAAGQPQGNAFVLLNDPGTIVVVQVEEVHRCIEELLRDLRRQMKIQIFVEARFLDVRTNFLREVGFEWDDFVLNGDMFDGRLGSVDGFGVGGGGLDFLLTPLPAATVVPTVDPDTGELTFSAVGADGGFGFVLPEGSPGFDVDPDTGAVTFTPTSLGGSPFVGTRLPVFGSAADTGMNLNFAWGDEDGLSLSGMFRMAALRDEVETVSAPQITATNGQRVELAVTTDRDYVSTFDVDEGVLIPEVDTVSDAISLMVRPIAGPDLRYVFLELVPNIAVTDLTRTVSFETFTGQPGGGGDGGGAAGDTVTNFITLPTVNERSLATTVGVPDRGLVVVGGLGESTRQHIETGVPILSQIPILKRLFTSEGRQIDRSTTFIMAKPQIIVLGEEEQRMR